jgi:hypothetical protein
MKKLNKIILVLFLTALLLFLISTTASSSADGRFKSLLDEANEYIVVRNKVLGGSHYAYTEGLSDDTNSPDGNESVFRPGSKLVLLTLKENNGELKTNEEVLISSPNGVIRDPDVSTDGTTVLFSWKKNNNDDFHLYIMDLTAVNPIKTITQITFGSGVADIEPKFLPDGRIVFNSSRVIQNVDCWVTPVSNLHICDADGSNIIRVGFDQVHTTYPTVTKDGRVIYTRWDYSDRNQMFIQGIFQMMPDGINQTELYGNNNNFPTSLLHTRDIPGATSKYVSIVSGHHTFQAGKLVIIDIAAGRNNKDSVEYVFPDRYSNKNENVDGQGQEGALYRYPYALNENEFLVSYAEKWKNGADTLFDIYYMNTNGEKELICSAKSGMPASQIIPVKKRDLFQRPNSVNYASKTGTVYVGNVYAGEGMEGVKIGEAVYLRVVELELRPYAIGANQASGTGSSDPFTPVSTGNGTWDIKKVLGIVNIEPDGSALFRIPAEKPVYFQILNKNGELIQSMRSWTTLMPGETFSCVGCHEDKNTAPPAISTITMAMQKGPQEIKKDLWMKGSSYDNYTYKDAKGFSYLEMVQPILDKSCISCHNNREESERKLKTQSTKAKNIISNIIERDDIFTYTTNPSPLNISDGWTGGDFDDSSWRSGKGPFAMDASVPPGGHNTVWNGSGTRLYFFLRKTFELTQEQIEQCGFNLLMSYDESPVVYVNGKKIFEEKGYITSYTDFDITKEIKPHLHAGTNIIAIQADNRGGGGSYLGFDLQLYDNSSQSENNTKPFSLESTPILGKREKMYYALSYLVLTNSTNTGVQFKGNSDKSDGYANWISNMSQCEVLKPYQFGSTKSRMMSILKEGHKGVKLTTEEMYILSEWMDLGVPMRGSYSEVNNWSANDIRESEEKDNKRAYYDMADRVVKEHFIKTETILDDKIKIEYFTNTGTLVNSKTDAGLVQLYPGQQFTNGYKIIVTLPKDEKYLYFNLDSRLAEALIYVPDGKFEYTIPMYINDIFPKSVRNFNNPTISARIPSVSEMTAEKNLALNPYDLTNSKGVFPHASASNSYGDEKSNPEFQPRNAIDGFKNNKGHGKYPVQSWGPDQNVSDLWFNIDFGRKVDVNRIIITLRADFDHDTNFTAAKIIFSGGETQNIVIEKTAEPQEFIINGKISATSVKLQLTAPANSWTALTEVEVFGSDNGLK